MDKKVEAIIVATDPKGRNKARFCESFKRRYYLLSKQGFNIHEAILLPEKMTKQESIDYVLSNPNVLVNQDNLVVFKKPTKNKISIESIRNRARKQLSNDEIISIVESVVNA